MFQYENILVKFKQNVYILEQKASLTWFRQHEYGNSKQPEN